MSISAAEFLKWCEVFNVVTGGGGPIVTFPLPPSLGGTGVSNSDSNTLTISGVSTINQDVSTTSSPSFTAVTPGNININGNTISSTNTNGAINLIPNGTGSINCGSSTSLGYGTALQYAKNSTQGVFALGTFLNSNAPSSIRTLKSRATSVGSFAAVQNNDNIGGIGFYADDGASYNTISGAIVSTVSGSVSTGVIPSQMTFWTTTTGGLLATAMTISNAQVVTLANPLPVASGGTGITSLGTGVATALGIATTATGGFATQVNNTSFTPVVSFAIPGDVSVSYSTQVGSYSRNGNIVVYNFGLAFTPTYTTSSGVLTISLPITAGSAAQGWVGSLGNSGGANATYPAGRTMVVGNIDASNSILYLRASGTGVASSNMTTANFTSGLSYTISGSITYAVA